MLVAALVTALVAACSPRGGGRLSDLLALVPANDEFSFSVGDLEAHREAIDVPAPAADAPADEVDQHRARLLVPGGDQLVAGGATLGINDSTGDLLPLARGSAVILDHRSNTEVIRGEFADDAFGGPAPNGEDIVDVGGVYALAVEDGMATIAPGRDEVDAALKAQHGDAESLADVPTATQLASALDDLEVIHATAVAYPDGDPVNAVATGVAVDPDREGVWRLIVAHHPSNAGNLAEVVGKLDELAREYADEEGVQVVEVASRGGIAVAAIRVEDPNVWLELLRRFDPLVTRG